MIQTATEPIRPDVPDQIEEGFHRCSGCNPASQPHIIGPSPSREPHRLPTSFEVLATERGTEPGSPRRSRHWAPPPAQKKRSCLRAKATEKAGTATAPPADESYSEATAGQGAMYL